MPSNINKIIDAQNFIKEGGSLRDLKKKFRQNHKVILVAMQQNDGKAFETIIKDLYVEEAWLPSIAIKQRLR